MSREEVVLLDEEGRSIGTVAKAEVHHRETPLHLAFSCYLFDGEGRLLLTRRALHKPTWRLTCALSRMLPSASRLRSSFF